MCYLGFKISRKVTSAEWLPYLTIHLAWSFLQTGLSGWLFFRKGCYLEFLGVFLWCACKYLWWRLALCGDQTIDLQDELISWFLYGLGFCQGYFGTDYSIVLILETAITCFLHLFQRSVLWWFPPLNVFLTTNCFISWRYFSLTVFIF